MVTQDTAMCGVGGVSRSAAGEEAELQEPQQSVEGRSRHGAGAKNVAAS